MDYPCVKFGDCSLSCFARRAFKMFLHFVTLWPFDLKIIPSVGYLKVIPYTKFEHSARRKCKAEEEDASLNQVFDEVCRQLLSETVEQVSSVGIESAIMRKRRHHSRLTLPTTLKGPRHNVVHYSSAKREVLLMLETMTMTPLPTEERLSVYRSPVADLRRPYIILDYNITVPFIQRSLFAPTGKRLALCYFQHIRQMARSFFGLWLMYSIHDDINVLVA